jgi:hypothetical protein
LHNRTRVDHHEDEIKKLRGRIDELKMKLTTAEDEVYILNPCRQARMRVDENWAVTHCCRRYFELHTRKNAQVVTGLQQVVTSLFTSCGQDVFALLVPSCCNKFGTSC